MHAMNDAEALAILERLREIDIEEPVGGAIEIFVDHFNYRNEPVPITDEVVPIFERFLRSRNLDNRSAALMALVQEDKRYHYAVDAVLLHFQSRDHMSSPEEFAALRFLYQMMEGGNPEADRAADVLSKDPYVQGMQGW